MYNLLPYRKLDGGSVIALFTSGSTSEAAAERLLTIIKLCFSALLLLLVIRSGTAVLPLFIGSVILFISDMRAR